VAVRTQAVALAPALTAPQSASVSAAGVISRVSETASALLLVGSFAVIQALIGGTRLVFSLPAYGLLAVMAVVAATSIGQIKSRPNRVCLFSTALFLGYVVARAVLSPVDYLARPDTYLVLGCLIVYLFVAFVFTDAKPRVLFFFFLLAVAVVHVCIGAIQFRDGTNYMLISFLQRFDYGRRASGLYVCPNHLAGFLEVVGIFGLSIACWGRWSVWVRLVALYGACACYVGVLLSASRGGYVSCLASFLVFLVLSIAVLVRTGRQFFKRIGGALVIFVIATLIGGGLLTNKMLYLNDRVGPLAAEQHDIRDDLSQAALQQWKLQPLIGTGSGTYLFYGRQFRTDRVDADPVEVHNDYLHLLAEYGIIGGVGFLIFLGVHLLRGWKNFQRLGPKRVAASTSLLSNRLALQIGALSAVGAYLVHSAVDFNLHIPANALLLAFVFGLLANAGLSQGAKRLTIIQLAPLPILGIVVAIQCVRLLPAEYFAERARVALRDNDPTTSATYAVRALETEQKNPNIYYYLGQAGVLEGNAATDPEKRGFLFQVSITAFKKGWELVRQDETFPLALASVYDGLEQFPEAESMYEVATQLDPNSPATKAGYKAHLERWRAANAAILQEISTKPSSD